MKPTNLKKIVSADEKLDLSKIGGFQGLALRKNPKIVYEKAFYWPSTKSSGCGKQSLEHIMYRESSMKTLCLRPGCNSFM